MTTLRELREQRAAAFATAQEFMHQHEAGKLTREGEREWQRALDAVDRLTREIRSTPGGEQDSFSTGDIEPAGRGFTGLEVPDPPGVDGGAPLGRTVNEPVFLRNNQSVAGWARNHGLIRADDAGLSFDRYLRGVATGDWAGSVREQELYQRALAEGTLSAGGHLVPTPLSAQVIDLARNATRVVQAGAVTIPMTAQTLKVPRLTGEGAPAWHAENAAITDQDLTFDAVTFTARTLTRLVKISIELFEDSDPAAGDVIARSFAAQIALEVDRVALRGSGTVPEPRGVLNQSGVTLTDHGTDGTAIADYDWWLDAAGVVMGNNFEPNAHIQAPRSSTSLRKLKEATTNAYLQPPANMLPMLATKQVPIDLTVGTSNDCSEIYTAQWDLLMIGLRTQLMIAFLRERYVDNGQYAFLAWLRADIQLAQPSAFVVDRGVRG